MKALKRFFDSTVTGKNSKSSPKLFATFKLFRLYMDDADAVGYKGIIEEVVE